MQNQVKNRRTSSGKYRHLFGWAELEQLNELVPQLATLHQSDLSDLRPPRPTYARRGVAHTPFGSIFQVDLDKFEIKLDIRNFKPEDIEIRANGQDIFIAGQRKASSEFTLPAGFTSSRNEIYRVQRDASQSAEIADPSSSAEQATTRMKRISPDIPENSLQLVALRCDSRATRNYHSCSSLWNDSRPSPDLMMTPTMSVDVINTFSEQSNASSTLGSSRTTDEKRIREMTDDGNSYSTPSETNYLIETPPDSEHESESSLASTSSTITVGSQ